MPPRFARCRSLGLVLGASAALAFGIAACSSFGSQSSADAGSEPLVDGATSPEETGTRAPLDAAKPTDAAQSTDAPSSDASDGGPTDASEAGPLPRTFRYLYAFSPTARSAISSIAAADAACFAVRPVGVVAVKALLVGTTRTACTSANCATGGAAEHLDWPLVPATEYRRADGTTVIGRTNAIGLFESLTSSIGLVDDFVWTGLSPNGMGTGTNWTTSASTCQNWASTSAAQNGAAAYAGPSFKSYPFGHFFDTCDKNFVFYCAESN